MPDYRGPSRRSRLGVTVRTGMHGAIHSLLASIMFFTRVPCGRWYRYDPSHEARASVFLPAVGWLVGAVAAAVYLLTAGWLPANVAVVIVLCTSALLTGAMHEDGFADFCDALGAGGDRKRTLEIMSDPRIGAYGATGLVLALLLKYSTLSALLGGSAPGAPARAAFVFALLIGAHASSRWAAAAIMAVYDHARPDGGPKSASVARRMSGADLALSSVFGLAPVVVLALIGGAPLLAAALSAPIAAGVLASLFLKRLGGYTGDCLGAVQQVAEILFYGAVLTIASFGVPPAP
ncbi:MAG: adenosylcobinamide-GDP ribazoletransferase [Gammaproteobacteria bacterium]